MVSPVTNGQGKSMAIWFPLKGTQTLPTTPTANLHFNLWRLGHRGQEADKAATPDLLDIGIKITSPAEFNEISIYLPIKVNEACIEDLGPRFSDGTLATGIFNESLTATNGPSQSVIILKNASGGTHCGVVKFPLSNDQVAASHLKFTHEFDGTTITIMPAAIAMGIADTPNNEDLYFRLRLTIPKNGVSTFFNAAIPDDKLLTSGVDITEYLDFRLNQTRNLNPGIAQKMAASGGAAAVQITRLDFLLVVGVAVDVVVGHPGFHKCRLLETGLWKSYVDEAHLQKGMVIYHWKNEAKDGSLEDFNAFVKLRLRLSGKRIIWRYLLIASLFGVIVGVCGNTVYDAGKWSFWGIVDTVRGTPAKVAPMQAATSCPQPVAVKVSEPLLAAPESPPPKLVEAIPGGKAVEHGVNGAPLEAGTNATAGTDSVKKGTQ